MQVFSLCEPFTGWNDGEEPRHSDEIDRADKSVLPI